MGTGWLESLTSIAPERRDVALEERLGIALVPPGTVEPPGEDLIGYHASSVTSIARACLEVPITKNDVLVDLGAGLGKVVMLAKLLTGATARGIELQRVLVESARAAAARAEIDVSFVEGDVRDAALDDGTVFFLYTPFTGVVLDQVMKRLRRVAEERAIVVVTNGIDLERASDWLTRRACDSFWIAVYDSHAPRVGEPARGAIVALALGEEAR